MKVPQDVDLFAEVPFVAYTPPDHDQAETTGFWESAFIPADSLFGSITPLNEFTIVGPDDWACKIRWGDAGWQIEVNQALDWDGNAKHFWNAVARVIGQKAPFGW